MNAAWPIVNLIDWVSNASAKIGWYGTTSLPVSVAVVPRHKNASYIFSPRSAWFDYLAHECRRKPLSALAIQFLGKIVSFLGIDKTAFIGNYPISTSIWTESQMEEIPSIATTIMTSQPKHFIGIRNILPHRHAKLIKQLAHLDFKAIPSRVIYEFDLRSGLTQTPSHLKRDLSLLKKLNLTIKIATALTQQEIIRVHQLYQQIYLEKHSLLNPQYTLQFFDQVVNQRIMTCLMIGNSSNSIVSFALICTSGETISIPALGYDSEYELEGSYRVLFAAIYTHAKNAQALLNYSSGAGDFKRKRGGIPYLEYTYLKCPKEKYGLKRRLIHFAAKLTSQIDVQDLIKQGA